ncbi:hypothetical protein HPP92_023035 [Vanilla planifolia]|uniref:Uncharacterized protein n=1 Tax=Vanilla planifolia TaxID=51239 RepID=A0A835PV99_VANPL|nr:hypothetical protein HPP92_023035 [Vanilla planifolia]
MVKAQEMCNGDDDYEIGVFIHLKILRFISEMLCKASACFLNVSSWPGDCQRYPLCSLTTQWRHLKVSSSIVAGSLKKEFCMDPKPCHQSSNQVRRSTKSLQKRGRAKKSVLGKRKSRRNLEASTSTFMYRARKDQATDSHSLPEEITLPLLHEKVYIWVTGKALVLDEIIINYVKCLKNQVEFLSINTSVNPILCEYGLEFETTSHAQQRQRRTIQYNFDSVTFLFYSPSCTDELKKFQLVSAIKPTIASDQSSCLQSQAAILVDTPHHSSAQRRTRHSRRMLGVLRCKWMARTWQSNSKLAS